MRGSCGLLVQSSQSPCAALLLGVVLLPRSQLAAPSPAPPRPIDAAPSLSLPTPLTSPLCKRRITSLLLPVTAPAAARDRPIAADEMWDALSRAFEPVLRTAFQHVHNCKCDVVASMAGALQ